MSVVRYALSVALRLYGALAALLIALKLLHITNMPWFVVLAPFWPPLAAACALAVLIIIDLHREARRSH